MSIRILLILSLIFSAGPGTQANVFYRPQSIEEMNELLSMEPVKMVYVPGSKVAWANYEALRRDFPFLQNQTTTQINNWIVANFSYVTQSQLELVNWRSTEIPADTNKRTTAFRQSNYELRHKEFQGRGGVFEVKDLSGAPAGLIDMKGVGVSVNKLAENRKFIEAVEAGTMTKADYQKKGLSNGLMGVGDGMEEILILEVTQKIFDLLNITGDSRLPTPENWKSRGQEMSLQTVESYFLLQLPFSILNGTNQPQPAAIYARQPHLGRVWMGKVFHPLVNIKQADFFFGLADGETVRIRDPRFKDHFAENEYLRDINLRSFDIAPKLEDALTRDVNAFYKIVDAALEPIKKEIAQNLTAAQNAPTKSVEMTSMKEALRMTAEIIEADPLRFARGTEVLIWANDRNMKEISHLPAVQNTTRTLLKVDATVVDHDQEGQLRRWGVLLIPSLKDPNERQQALRAEMTSPTGLKEAIATVAWMFPPAEIAPYLDQLIKEQGPAFLDSVTKKLRQRQVSNDPRFDLLVKYWKRASNEPGLRERAQANSAWLDGGIRREVFAQVNTCEALFVKR